MADLLRSGQTMLNMACPVCNNPLFKNKEDEIFCPVCNRKVMVVKENHIMPSETENSTNNDFTEPESSLKSLTKDLKEILLKKIEYISQRLKEETQIEILHQNTQTLQSIFKLLKRLK